MNPQRVKLVCGLVTTGFEMFVLAEILWFYLHNGESTLHGAVADQVRKLERKVRHDTSVADTLEMIRDLPETEG